jgi:hypothetical protein
MIHILEIFAWVVPALIMAWLVGSGRMISERGRLRPPDPDRIPDVAVPVDVQHVARALIMSGQRTAAVKEIRRSTGLPLASALDVVEALRRGIELPPAVDHDD